MINNRVIYLQKDSLHKVRKHIVWWDLNLRHGRVAYDEGRL